jgi:hypothetical protein
MNPAEIVSLITSVIDKLGFPTAVLIVLAYSFRKFILFVVPLIEQAVAAYVSRQQETTTLHGKLVDETIRLQSGTQAAISRIEEKLPVLCRHISASTPAPTPTPQLLAHGP